MQAVLVMFRSDGERRSVSIVHDSTVIGRGEECELRIGMLEVSRRHCRLVRDGAALKIQDLGSSNGTFVNGQRTSEAKLVAGDRIQIGPILVVVQINGHPPDSQIEPGAVRSPPPKPRPGGESGLEVDLSADQPYDPMADFAIEEDKKSANEEDDERVNFDFGDSTPSDGDASDA